MNRRTKTTAVAAAVLAAVMAMAGLAWAQTGGLFTDLGDDHRNYDDIKHAVGQGWFKGYADGSYKPDKEITADQIATVILRAWDGMTRAEFASFMRGGQAWVQARATGAAPAVPAAPDPPVVVEDPDPPTTTETDPPTTTGPAVTEPPPTLRPVEGPRRLTPTERCQLAVISGSVGGRPAYPPRGWGGTTYNSITGQGEGAALECEWWTITATASDRYYARAYSICLTAVEPFGRPGYLQIWRSAANHLWVFAVQADYREALDDSRPHPTHEYAHAPDKVAEFLEAHTAGTSPDPALAARRPACSPGEDGTTRGWRLVGGSDHPTRS